MTSRISWGQGTRYLRHSEMSTPTSHMSESPTTNDHAESLKLVDLGGLHARMRDELDRAMDEVLSESSFIRGKHVEAFEHKLAHSLKLDGHVVGCGNGTDALSLALRVLEVGPGDEVIVPDFSFIATAEVVSSVGATPVFADIDPSTFQLDPASAEQARTLERRLSWWSIYLDSALTWTRSFLGPKQMDCMSSKTTPKAWVQRGMDDLFPDLQA